MCATASALLAAICEGIVDIAGGQESRRNPAGCQQGGDVDGVGWSSVRGSGSAMHGSVDRRLGRRSSAVDTGDGRSSQETESQCRQVDV